MSHFVTAVARCAARYLGNGKASSHRHATLLTRARPCSSAAGATPWQDSDTPTRSGEYKNNTVKYNCSSSSSSPVEWDRYLAGGAAGMLRAVVHETGNRVKIYWKDGHESEFTFKWLRDHCPGSFNPYTRQRELDTHAIPDDIRVQNVSISALSTDSHPQQQQLLELHWSADTSSGTQADEYRKAIPGPWLRRHCTSAKARDLRKRYAADDESATTRVPQVLWGADVFSRGDDAPCMDYARVMSDALSSRSLVRSIRSHGIALVRGVPTDEAGTEALALKVGGHLRSTLYGPGMWATSADAEAGEEGFRDSAYSSDALALHTDCGYLADPPGLQVFTCITQATEGGASIYVDGFAVAERLRVENPEAFDFFSSTPVAYQCFDEGCHYRAQGPIFRLGSLGQVVQMRHNDYDRAPLDYLSNDDIDRFYEHHRPLSTIIRDESMVVRILLEPGETVILNNQRAMHGRECFKGRRRMIGCYIGMDELESTARVHGV